MAQPNSLLSLLNDDEDDGASSLSAPIMLTAELAFLSGSEVTIALQRSTVIPSSVEAGSMRTSQIASVGRSIVLMSVCNRPGPSTPALTKHCSRSRWLAAMGLSRQHQGSPACHRQMVRADRQPHNLMRPTRQAVMYTLQGLTLLISHCLHMGLLCQMTALLSHSAVLGKRSVCSAPRSLRGG